MAKRKIFVDNGERYNSFTIIKETVPRYGQRAVLCKCDCGDERIRSLYDVLHGKAVCFKCTRRNKFIVGQKINMLIAVKELPQKHSRRRILCKCDCSNNTKVYFSEFICGKVKSCGCLIRKRTIERNFKHGKSNTPEYRSWAGMKTRCYNKNQKSYPGYGGRGICVCKRWRHSFKNFLSDMGNRPSPNHSLDRIKNGKNYKPSNCRWATKKEQNNNTRTNRYLIHLGKRMTLAQISDKCKIDYNMLLYRLDELGWSLEKSLRTPSRYTNHPNTNHPRYASRRIKHHRVPADL
jgi:hypothetical protein